MQQSSLRSASSLGRSSKLSSFFFVQRVSLSFCAFLAGCFSHPYWLAGAGGFEPLHLEIRSAELHPASTGSRRRSGAPLIRDAQVRVPPPGLRVLAYSDLICRGSNPAAPASQSGLFDGASGCCGRREPLNWPRKAEPSSLCRRRNRVPRRLSGGRDHHHADTWISGWYAQPSQSRRQGQSACRTPISGLMRCAISRSI